MDEAAQPGEQTEIHSKSFLIRGHPFLKEMFENGGSTNDSRQLL